MSTALTDAQVALMAAVDGYKHTDGSRSILTIAEEYEEWLGEEYARQALRRTRKTDEAGQ